ncbi:MULTISPECIES: nuclear transport factor 2 family protein [unclassified Phyllobacterium]|uniref:nuclear transport factor 2 family protein n=1 Tax=unclassified Phyllobacterium TaxID=2638441 RepID=UPI0030130A81
MTIPKQMTSPEVHDLLRRLFDAFTDPATTPEQFGELMTSDYIQRVDGKELDFAGFLDHSKALQTSISSSKVTFEHILTDGHSAATVHIAEAVKSDGKRIRLKVIAYYQFRGHRVSLVDELTHMFEGEASDRDLGSRATH